MALRIGVIRQDHIRRLTTVLAGSTVTAVSDSDEARARDVAARLAGARAFATSRRSTPDARNRDQPVSCRR